VRFTTVLFDVGDTLVKVPKPASVYHEILTDFGCTLDLPEVEAILAEIRTLLDEKEPHWVNSELILDSEAAVRRRRLHVDSLLFKSGLPCTDEARTAFYDLYVGTRFFTIFPDVAETLADLHRRGYRMGIVSNWESRLLQLCASHGIAEWFDFAVVSEIEGYSKPHRRLYERALELAGAPAEQVVHVGDKLREDVEGAASVGISAVLLDRAGDPSIEYQPRVSSLAELPDLLDRL